MIIKKDKTIFFLNKFLHSQKKIKKQSQTLIKTFI